MLNLRSRNSSVTVLSTVDQIFSLAHSSGFVGVQGARVLLRALGPNLNCVCILKTKSGLFSERVGVCPLSPGPQGAAVERKMSGLGTSRFRLCILYTLWFCWRLRTRAFVIIGAENEETTMRVSSSKSEVLRWNAPFWSGMSLC